MPKVKLTKVPVSRRAVIQRINRAIAAEGLVFKATRGAGAQRHFALEHSGTNEVEFVETEAYARRRHIIGEWEEVVDPHPHMLRVTRK